MARAPAAPGGALDAMAQTTLDAPVLDDTDLDAFFEHEDLWAVIVWNDDVNTFAHVIKALVEILHHTLERAQALTSQVHYTGRAVVGVRPRPEAEAVVAALHRRLIQASLEPA